MADIPVTTHPDQLATINDPRRVVFITGCSAGGIGWHLADEFGKTGRYRVFASARSMQKMRTLPPTVERIELDVTDEKSVNKAVESVIQEAGRIDILVNNAGVSTAVGPAAEVSLDRIRSNFETNFFGLIRVTQAALKHMIPQAKKDKNKAGMVVNIGSVAGYGGVPYSAAYSATKSAVHTFSDSLRMELRPFGIKTVVIAPGKIRSSIGDNASGQLTDNLVLYSHVADQVAARAQLSQTGTSMDTDKFAQAVIKHLEAHGALGADQIKRGLLSSLIPSNGAYATIGPLGWGLWVMYYFPPWLRDAVMTRTFGLSRIGQWRNAPQTKKQK